MPKLAFIHNESNTAVGAFDRTVTTYANSPTGYAIAIPLAALRLRDVPEAAIPFKKVPPTGVPCASSSR